MTVAHGAGRARISPTTATNAITIKDTPERIAAAARVVSAIDKARPEVIIESSFSR